MNRELNGVLEDGVPNGGTHRCFAQHVRVREHESALDRLFIGCLEALRTSPKFHSADRLLFGAAFFNPASRVGNPIRWHPRYWTWLAIRECGGGDQKENIQREKLHVAGSYRRKKIRTRSGVGGPPDRARGEFTPKERGGSKNLCEADSCRPGERSRCRKKPPERNEYAHSIPRRDAARNPLYSFFVYLKNPNDIVCLFN